MKGKLLQRRKLGIMFLRVMIIQLSYSFRGFGMQGYLKHKCSILLCLFTYIILILILNLDSRFQLNGSTFCVSVFKCAVYVNVSCKTFHF